MTAIALIARAAAYARVPSGLTVANEAALLLGSGYPDARRWPRCAAVARS
jgi:hypothetical protein